MWIEVEGYKEFFKEVIEELVSRIRDFYGKSLVSVVIFGSVARNKFTPESDIDILIVADGLPRGRYARIKDFLDNIEVPIERKFKERGVKFIPEISPVIKTPEEIKMGSPLLLDMTQEALILYDKRSFFKNYIENLRDRLKKLGAVRVQRGGGWYWKLKPDYIPGEEIET